MHIEICHATGLLHNTRCFKFYKIQKKKKDLFKVIKVELSKVNTDRHRDKIIHEGLLHFQRRAQRKCYHP